MLAYNILADDNRPKREQTKSKEWNKRKKVRERVRDVLDKMEMYNF